jgi:hypothetical protein
MSPRGENTGVDQRVCDLELSDSEQRIANSITLFQPRRSCVSATSLETGFRGLKA